MWSIFGGQCNGPAVRRAARFNFTCCRVIGSHFRSRSMWHIEWKGVYCVLCIMAKCKRTFTVFRNNIFNGPAARTCSESTNLQSGQTIVSSESFPNRHNRPTLIELVLFRNDGSLWIDRSAAGQFVSSTSSHFIS